MLRPHPQQNFQPVALRTHFAREIFGEGVLLDTGADDPRSRILLILLVKAAKFFVRNVIQSLTSAGGSMREGRDAT